MRLMRDESGDLRPSEPADRLIALEAVIDARGHALPLPPVCHGYSNCCGCPVCLLRQQKPLAKEFMAA
jgi:hypothetical protein